MNIEENDIGIVREAIAIMKDFCQKNNDYIRHSGEYYTAEDVSNFEKKYRKVLEEKQMNMRTAQVIVVDRKAEISTSSNFTVKFDSVFDLLNQIDQNIGKLHFNKVDVEIEDDSQFSDDEIEELSNENIFVS